MATRALEPRRAERVHIGRLQSIANHNAEFVPPAEMLDRSLADNRDIAHRQREEIEICERNQDTPTSNILQDLLDKTEKRIWVLFDAAQGGRHTA